jgi:cytochrome c peroxidase
MMTSGWQMVGRLLMRVSVRVIPVVVILIGAVLVVQHEVRSKNTGPHAAFEELKAQFQRPARIPVPRENIPSPVRIALGERLFNEVRLSADDSVSCASCHNPALAYTDGVARGHGIAKERLPHHTPSLWNLAWAPALFWDGRARTLEEQAIVPMAHPKEMAQPIERGAEKLAADASYREAFRAAFPKDPRITPENIVKAIASFERTLVSPRTRFDYWIEGETSALTGVEIEGFRLFTGKGRCVSCHSGWAFTDHAFHDIGLPGEDLGRGLIVDLPRIDRAFKTPSLRELVWIAPFMHDGSLDTLDDVVRHYETGGIPRPTRSPDLPARLAVTDRERESLIAFLESLSSDRPPRPADIRLATGEPTQPPGPSVATLSVSQRDKKFAPERVALARGQSLTVINNDVRPHNVRIFDPRLQFNSGVQEPGDQVTVPFAESGTFEVFCGIHPTMRLSVEVH